jgi:tripartite-type tricarboxylate transporter receptor subunit TctC
MMLSRRDCMLLAGTGTLSILSRGAGAQSYPARPVHWIVPWPAGGAADISARIVGQRLAAGLGQPFVIENRAGAGGNIGTELALKQQPDGYTLLLVGSFNAINATLYERLNFNFQRDAVPVAGIMSNPLVMEVHPSVPAKTLPEFIAYAKANPGKLNMASAGNGSPQHIAGELFKMMADVEMVHVPFRGSAPMLTSLLAGEVQVTFDPMLSSIAHLRSGSLIPLAVTTATRFNALADIPTIGEYIAGYETSGWTGLAVAKGTPGDIIERLNTQVNACLADEVTKTRFSDLGAVVFSTRPSEFANFIVNETQKFAKVIKFAGIKPG